MLKHLLEVKPTVFDVDENIECVFKKPLDTTATEAVDAAVNTSNWLEDLGAVSKEEVLAPLQREAAAKAFASVVSAQPDRKTVDALSALKSPIAVKQLIGTLTAYEWDFVEKAKEIRGYVVAHLMNEVETSDNANVRIKALTALGRVTEVGLFTDKISIEKTEVSDEEIDQRIRDKLSNFMNVTDVLDITTIENVTDVDESE